MTHVYHYDETKQNYLGSSVAQIDPVERTAILPANATFQEPPRVGEHETAIFDGDAWNVHYEPPEPPTESSPKEEEKPTSRESGFLMRAKKILTKKGAHNRGK